MTRSRCCTVGWIHGRPNKRGLTPSRQHCAQLPRVPPSPSFRHHYLRRRGRTHSKKRYTCATHTHTHARAKEEALQAFPLINTCSHFDCFSWSLPALRASCYIPFPGNPFPVQPHRTVTLANMCGTITSAACGRLLSITSAGKKKGSFDVLCACLIYLWTFIHTCRRYKREKNVKPNKLEL